MNRLFSFILCALLAANFASCKTKKITPEVLKSLYEPKNEYTSSFEILEFGQLTPDKSFCVYSYSQGPCLKTFIATQKLGKKKASEILGDECDQDLGSPQHTWVEYNKIDSLNYEQITHVEKVPDSVLVNGNFKDGKTIDDYEIIEETSKTIITVLPDGSITQKKQ